MAVAAWATDLTDIILEPSTSTGWTALGGGASGLPSGGESDFYVQGSLCMSKAAWTNAVKGFMYTGGGPWTIPTDGVLLCWALYGPATASLATKANGGLRIVVGNDSSNYYSYYVGGSDTLTFETWIPIGLRPGTATVDATAGSPSGTWSVFGVVANLPTTAGPTKGNPLGMDALRYGRHTLSYTGGTSTDPDSTFALTEATANSGSNRWGNIEFNKGAYYVQGFHSFGTSGAALVFTDSNKVLFIRECAHNTTNDAVTTAYNRFEIINASTVVTWDNIAITSLGTRSRGTFVVTSGSLVATSCQFVDMETFTFLSSSTVTDCIFRRCSNITAPGTDMTGSQVLASRAAADTSAVIWNVATDPDGLLDDMTFTKGTNAHHAIELGTSSPTTVTLRGITFTGFNTSNAANDSVIHVKRTSGSVTINVVGGSGTVSYKTDGATVSIVLNPVTLAVNVKTTGGTNLSGARVLVKAETGGSLPYNASVSITRSGSTATVTHTSHGLATNQYIVISGATETEYNGVFQITVTGTNSYTYTVTGTPATPATGTPVATAAIVSGTTDASGNISDTRSYATNQPYSGKSRKASGSPYYKTASFSGTLDKTTGASVNVQMIQDE